MIEPAIELRASRKLPRTLRVYVDGELFRAVVSPRNSHGTWLAFAYAVPSACYIGTVGGDTMLFFGETRFEITDTEARELAETLQLRDKRAQSSSDKGETK